MSLRENRSNRDSVIEFQPIPTQHADQVEEGSLDAEVIDALTNDNFLVQYSEKSDNEFEFAIKNDKGEDILSSSCEYNSCACRTVYQLSFVDRHSKEVFRLTRTGGFCFEPYVFEIESPPEGCIAKIKLEPFPIAPRLFTITNQNNQRLWRIKSARMFSSDFRIFTRRPTGTEIGTYRKISHAVSVVNVCSPLDVKMKIILLASVIYVDIVLRKK